MIPACFSKDYVVPTRSRSMLKLGSLAHALDAEGLADLIDPGILNLDLLYRLHAPDYVQDFLSGQMPLAVSQNLPWSEALRTAVIAMQAGQIKGARIAMEQGMAANIANGFHHAKYSKGGGFCTFNGLAMVAMAFPNKRVFVLDCDEHGGNGTEDFAARLSNLFNYSIFGKRFGCQGGINSVADSLESGPRGFSAYLKALQRAFDAMSDWRPDIVIYQAGVDCHKDDPIGQGFLSETCLIERDTLVFQHCLHESIPILFTMAGGYHELEQVVRLHCNTFHAAVSALNGSCASAANSLPSRGRGAR